jgi:hypothetical protein
MLKTLGLSLRKPKMQHIEITALKRPPEIAGTSSGCKSGFTEQSNAVIREQCVD